MSDFRAKQMALTEWAPFQNRFEKLFMQTAGDKRMALFMRSVPGEDLAILLVPDFNFDAVEALSPGGWEPFPAPEKHKWVLLVGNASAAEDFGLTLGI